MMAGTGAGGGETAKEPSGFTVDTLQTLLNSVLSERDRRYEQRFLAQEKAVELALARVDKEFHEHLEQVRTETRAALEAADKAITKSEAATEKRFESVNEFRAQLADQSRTFMPRTESISRHERTGEQIEALVKAVADLRDRMQKETAAFMPRAEAEQRANQNAEKIDALDKRMREDIATINSRLDMAAGRGAGYEKGWGLIIGAVGLIGAVIAIVFAFVAH